MTVVASETSCVKMSRALAAGAVLSGVVVVVRAYRSWLSQPRSCPRVPGHWLFGNLPQILGGMRDHRLHDVLADMHREHGDTLVLNLPLQPRTITTVDPANVEHILKTNFTNYPKGSLIRSRMTDLLGDGIFNADNDLWHSQRKVSSQMFTANKFKNHIWRVVEKNSAKVVDLLKASEGTAVDFFNLMNRFTLDSIGEIGFGTSVGSLEDPRSPFLKSFDCAQQITLLRFFVPAWQVLRFLGVGTESGGVGHFRLLREYSARIVASLRGAAVGSHAGDSFVGLFMKAAGRMGLPEEDAFMQDSVLNFLIAGRDTTAQAMSWCLFLVMQHPEVEAKILEEAAKVCGRGDGGAQTPLAYDQLGKLEYLQATIHEALRLFPSVPLNPKVCLQSDTLPDGTYVPAGSSVWYLSYGMGRNKKIWGEDAEDFRPERWLSMETPPTPYAYPVFHAGPRECLGKRLAMVEMKALLCMVLREVKLTLAVPASEIRADLQLTIGMSSGLPCNVAMRR